MSVSSYPRATPPSSSVSTSVGLSLPMSPWCWINSSREVVNGFWFRSQEDLDVMCFNVWSGNEMRLLFECSHHPCFLFWWTERWLWIKRRTKKRMRLERNEGWHARDWCWVFSSQSHEVMDRFALLKRRMALTWLCFNVVVVCSSLRCILSSKISTPSDSS